MAQIKLEGIEKWFGELQVIKGVDFEIEENELLVFVGPSGCGKSTLLRILAGLTDASRGKVIIDGRDVTGEPPSQRGLAMVFQSYALYPHMTVRENMGFALKSAGMPPQQVADKVNDVAQVLKLSELLDRTPKELSGGQRQRVAIGRSIVRDPVAFLFDEPLSNLDAALRIEMRFEIARLHRKLRSPMVYVTHDQTEAMTLANRIVVLRSGVVEQIGTPRELYNKPSSVFVAQFIGSPKMNLLPCSTEDGKIKLGDYKLDLQAPAGVTSLGIRPEHLSLVAQDAGHFNGTVDLAEYLGSDVMAHVDCKELGFVSVRCDSEIQADAGDNVGLQLTFDRCHMFGKDEMRVGD